MKKNKVREWGKWEDADQRVLTFQLRGKFWSKAQHVVTVNNSVLFT